MKVESEGPKCMPENHRLYRGRLRLVKATFKFEMCTGAFISLETC